MKCKCGRNIEQKYEMVFGAAAICSVCARNNVEARKAASEIKKIISNLYAIIGEEGITALKDELHPTLKQFLLLK